MTDDADSPRFVDADSPRLVDADSPRLVGHVHLKVRDLDVSVPFYRSVLGLEVTERHGRYVFLSWGERHHDVALQAVGEDAATPPAGPSVGLYHAAFEVDTGAALAAVHERLRARDVAVSPIDHGISKALYFDDPDGNGVEVYLDTRATTGRREWRGTNEPFDPADLVNERGRQPE